jgi:hypothetical protein
MIFKSDSAVWKPVGLLACLAVFLLSAVFSFGQQLTGTLTGTTGDTTGAVVANAKITLKNQQSGDVRTTVSNGSGHFAITAVQPGTYTVTITASGFKAWEQAGIVLAQGDNRNLPNIALQVGTVQETVEISAGSLAVPTDNAEISTTVPQNLIEDLPLANRDAGELLKIMPGMAFNNGASQGSGFATKTVGTNSGPVGNFSANGTQPNGAMAFMLDGANLVDPGNAGTQIANINQDMVSEVKVLMSDYSAEYAKGPVIFQAFSKSGGSTYHGEGYLYARNSALNAIDAYTHSQIADGSTTANLAAPAESFYYIGGNVGGPVPFLNKGRQKLFFWGGYEYMKQSPAGSIINYNVPTPAQLSGDFSSTGVPAGAMSAWQYAYNTLCCNQPAGATSTSVPTADFDPNGVNFAKLIPKPNITPNAGNGWNNFQYVSHVPQNRWEATGKVDYAIGDNTKLTGSYTRQIENDQHPVGIWWTPPWTLPYPSNVVAATTSQEVMINLTHVFSPTTTNEFVYTLARYINPSTLSNPSAVDRTKVGFNVTGLFGYTPKQIPNIDGPWGGAFPDVSEMNLDGPFNGQGFGATKKDPALYDNFTKVIGAHTLKVGMYWDTSENLQSSSGIGNGANGTYNLGWGANSTGNVVADFLLGRTSNYQQPSSETVFDIKSHQWSIYGQDSFKANRQLTLNYGLRLDHVGQWYGPANGMQVWNPGTYVNGTPQARITTPNTGLVWHAIDHSVPLSGLVSPLFYYEPRVGLAYDIFGNGTTVLRAGFASFRYQLAVNDVGGPTSGPAGIFTFTTNSVTSGYSQIDSGGKGFTPPSSVSQNGSAISAFQMGDNRTPYTNDWNITISQALPWRSVFEISYVGNKSANELLNGSNGKVNDINAVVPGSYFFPDPVTGLYVSPGNLSCNNSNAQTDALDCTNPSPNGGTRATNYKASFTQNDYRRLTNYQDIYLVTHGSYANYNSLQMSWQKHSGPIQFLTNYTFSKVMGIRDGQTDNGNGNGTLNDPFNLKSNYGPLAYDHTHILNFASVWNLPSRIHGHALLGLAANGWQLSSYTTYQSGAPLQPVIGGNLNAAFPGGLTVPLVGAPDLPDNSILLPNGLKSNAVNTGTWYGTDQTGGGYEQMVPTVTCDPRKHASGLYFNPNCFTVPGYGQLGTIVWPYVHLPAYFDSDLALYKNFKITERQSVQFRVSASNFLNHPLAQFGLAGNSDETLNFTRTSFMTENNASECALLNNGAAAPCQVKITSISPTNTNPTTTGKPAFKTGQRIMLFALKYYF